jgi:DNA-binding transcriptional regulator LsrR (DeoR family)
MRNAEIIEIGQEILGVGEGETVAAHLESIRRQNRKSHVSGGLSEH